jgi:hypothetical protein
MQNAIAAQPRALAGVFVDQRAASDRRQGPTPMFCRYTLLGGRRRGGRRVGERAACFVDQHGHGLFSALLGIVALNVLDAWFTLYFLSYGGQELNPVVNAVLGLGIWPFVWFKTLGIGACAVFLALTKNFRPARIGLAFVLVGYSLLLGWHLFLLSRLHGCLC